MLTRAVLCPFPHTGLTAALVIQGSAFVYSKKVEYLYSLVFQALEYISAHKKRDAAAAAAAAAASAGTGSGRDSGADEDLRPLDDIIESLCPIPRPHTNTPHCFAHSQLCIGVVAEKNKHTQTHTNSEQRD